MVKIIIFAVGLIAFCNQFDSTLGCPSCKEGAECRHFKECYGGHCLQGGTPCAAGCMGGKCGNCPKNRGFFSNSFSHGSEMPTREKLKTLMSNPQAQDRFINMLDGLLQMIPKPISHYCPPGIPPQVCKQFAQGGIPKFDDY